MTKYSYACNEDIDLINNSFNNIAYLILGKNNEVRLNAFREYFSKRVREVNIYKQGTTTKYLKSSTSGICRRDGDDIIIEMLGFNGASRNQYSWLKHEGTHEFCHSFVNLLPEVLSENPEGIVKNGIRYKNHMGMIRQTDERTGQLVGQHYYGKLFNETMMDIITSMAINSFDSNGRGTSADEILSTNYKSWGNETTGYSFLTSITRLTIAAFSNNGFANYQQFINNGFSIFDGTTSMDNGKSYKINDFLYGIVFDQMHIEKEFDKYMGEGSYKIFCEYLDRLYLCCLQNQTLPSEEVKRIMNIIPDFLNKKMNYYEQHGILSVEKRNQIVGNFNKIWNSMQKEYKTYFTQDDINKIAKRASRL